MPLASLRNSAEQTKSKDILLANPIEACKVPTHALKQQILLFNNVALGERHLDVQNSVLIRVVVIFEKKHLLVVKRLRLCRSCAL